MPPGGGRLLAAAYAIIGAMVFLPLLGLYADHRLGTFPWLLVVGLVAGLAVTALELWKLIQEQDADDDDQG